MSIPNGYEFEAEAVYQCNSGYELNGNSHRYCLRHGSWSGTAPTCKQIDTQGKGAAACDFQTWADPERGGQGVLTPPEKSQNIGFLSNTGLDSLENHKATKPAFNSGPLSARQ